MKLINKLLIAVAIISMILMASEWNGTLWWAQLASALAFAISVTILVRKGENEN
jgi:hypothetical protein